MTPESEPHAQLAFVVGALVINFNMLEGALHNLTWTGIGAGNRIGGTLTGSKDLKSLAQMLQDLLAVQAFGDDTDDVSGIVARLGPNGQRSGLIGRRNAVVHAALFNTADDRPTASLSRMRDLLVGNAGTSMTVAEIAQTANDARELAAEVSVLAERRFRESDDALK